MTNNFESNDFQVGVWSFGDTLGRAQLFVDQENAMIMISDVLGRRVGKVIDQGSGWADISGLEIGMIYFVTVKDGELVSQTTLVTR
jgi:hypothetical protein